ncbi:MAG: calcium/sodium antiporter [Candidatus Aminicenantes bacterium]|nr:calcium/sodium antiporter [Candidatus Aminicenantes bacterium]NIN23875.1 calcium/sodium antiporter [Candidatus Aminicenantes bacterium]NIO87151.1 calcium/sodium antiporter [Candidatus Aminicenantes bacterium]NIQ72986.1 calcium/sodium antiporter [Candidatus Aminicenantes bacterium]NIT29026.1 calcium/sodium antiporter [Candidatus Aminicenantes bacterium]
MKMKTFLTISKIKSYKKYVENFLSYLKDTSIGKIYQEYRISSTSIYFLLGAALLSILNLTHFALLLIGFVLLVTSANWLVDSAGKLGRLLNISQLAIGLTIVAFGTSAPEFFVNIIAAVKGYAGITVGDIFGSNIINICGGIGISSIICVLSIKQSTIKFELPFLIFSAIILIFLIYNFNPTISISSEMVYISKADGILLVLLFLFYIGYVYGYLIKKKYKPLPERKEKKEREKEKRWLVLAKTLIKISISILTMYFSGNIIVNESVSIARLLSIKESIIGATVVAFGTSIPDIFASIIATIKGNDEIAVGNIVGSNIFNTLWVLGVSAIVATQPLSLSNGLLIDFLIMMIISFLLFFISIIRKRIVKLDGFIFVLAYILYLLSILNRLS